MKPEALLAKVFHQVHCSLLAGLNYELRKESFYCH
jgi:hypothetical protein